MRSVFSKVDLIHCQGGNQTINVLAMRHNVAYGTRLPNRSYFKPYFTDQNWKNPEKEKYIKEVKKHRPNIATVLDLEREDQLEEVLDWARAVAPYVKDAVIIIPKVNGIISSIPDNISGVPVRLGYSVPTKYGRTEVPIYEFGRWPVHMLGGSIKRQLILRDILNAVSSDQNIIHALSAFGKFFVNGSWGAGGEYYWPLINQVYPEDYFEKPLFPSFELSIMNLVAANSGSRVMVRYAFENDITSIQKIARQWNKELGFLMKQQIIEAISKKELYVAAYDNDVVGFVNWHLRKDGWSTIYEIAVDKNWLGNRIGAALLSVIPRPVRLKVTQDNDRANAFYQAAGMKLVRTEPGRVRALSVYELLQWWDEEFVQPEMPKPPVQRKPSNKSLT